MKASITTLLHDPTLKYKVVHVPKKNPGMRAQRTMVVHLHAFLTSALYEGGWSASEPGSFTPGKQPPNCTEMKSERVPEPVLTF